MDISLEDGMEEPSILIKTEYAYQKVSVLLCYVVIPDQNDLIKEIFFTNQIIHDK